ncbi:MAG TPA: uL22 family ribosomal protein [Candidatus Paceibacterota bacterium]|nr:uL22 family ribosomal protein [Candidatus Paceibacterota bacterium]
MPKQTVQLNYLRIAPRKVRAVADMVKGLPVVEAEAQLLQIRRRPAVALLKLLRSGVASIKNNQHMSEEKFFVESFRVDGGPMLKRGLPRARGMMTPIQKKMSHVTLVLAENPDFAGGRFKIVVKKKAKLPPGEGKPIKEKRVGEKPERERVDTKKSGFFKRMFSRKAGMAK